MDTTPGDVRDETLRDLRAAHRKLMTANARRELAKQDPSTKKLVGQRMGELYVAITQLETEVLEDIATKLRENEAALRSTAEALRKESEKLRDFAEIAKRAEAALKALARVLPLLLAFGL